MSKLFKKQFVQYTQTQTMSQHEHLFYIPFCDVN
jgi:hypothetical protein